MCSVIVAIIFDHIVRTISIMSLAFVILTSLLHLHYTTHCVTCQGFFEKN